MQHGDIPRFDAVTNQISVASPTYSLPTNTYKQVIQSSLSYVAGQHDLKVGWQMTRGVRKTYFLAVSDYPAGLQAIYKNGVPDSVKTFNTPTGSDYTNLDNSLYLQDKWRIGQKFTANLGLGSTTISNGQRRRQSNLPDRTITFRRSASRRSPACPI